MDVSHNGTALRDYWLPWLGFSCLELKRIPPLPFCVGIYRRLPLFVGDVQYPVYGVTTQTGRNPPVVAKQNGILFFAF